MRIDGARVPFGASSAVGSAGCGVKVTVIIVTLNPRERLGVCLESLRANTKVAYETRVVAHGCRGEDVAWLKEAYPWVEIVDSGGGVRGFSENNNLGARGARGEYLFLLNDDTVLENDAVDRLAQDMDARPDAGIASPYLLNRDGSFQYCGGEEQTVWMWFLEEMRWKRMADRKGPHVGRDGVFETKNAVGAAMMVRRAVWEAAGGLDEKFFFAPEDVDLSVRARRMGWTILADAGARIYHLQSATLKRNFIPAMLAYQRGCILHWGGSVFGGIWVRMLVGLRDALKLCGWLLKGGGENAAVHRRLWWLMLKTVCSRKTPKELFVQYRTEVREGFVAAKLEEEAAGKERRP